MSGSVIHKGVCEMKQLIRELVYCRLRLSDYCYATVTYIDHEKMYTQAKLQNPSKIDNIETRK